MKLIVFGCSFTDYRWPTWADIIAEDLGCEYENWGLGGSGNQAIARRILYRSSLGLNFDDWVMIQWSGISREDRFIDGEWKAQGPISHSSFYGRKFIEKYWDWDNDVINTVQARITTEILLGDKLKYQSAMPWRDPEILSQSNDLTEYWKQRVTYCDELPLGTFPFQGKLDDGHPDPIWWMNFVKEKIYPRFNYTLKQKTIDKVFHLQNQIQSIVDSGKKSLELDTLNVCENLGWNFNKFKVTGCFNSRKILM